MSNSSYDISPIGRIKTSDGATRIEVGKKYTPALEGLEGFSHIWVVFWCHQADTEKQRGVIHSHKPYTKGPDVLGIFATRSPIRPNPVAMTPVQVLHLDPANGTILIPFIDAEDGTPIIDIKPYTPSIDRIRETASPDWCAHWPEWYEDSASFDWEAEFNF